MTHYLVTSVKATVYDTYVVEGSLLQHAQDHIDLKIVFAHELSEEEVKGLKKEKKKQKVK